MKLLTPQQLKDGKEQQNLLDIMRAQESRKLAEEWRVKLIKAEADFHATLARQRQDWALEESQHTERIKARQIELDEMGEILQDQLDTVGQKEQDLLLWEKRLNVRQQALDERAASIKAQSTEITKALSTLPPP